MVTQGFYFTLRFSVACFSLFLVGCSPKKTIDTAVFTFQKDIRSLPKSVRVPKTEKIKLYEKVLTLTSDILQGSMTRQPTQDGERFLISYPPNKTITLDITEKEDFIFLTPSAGVPEVEKAINYYFLTGVFERKYLE